MTQGGRSLQGARVMRMCTAALTESEVSAARRYLSHQPERDVLGNSPILVSNRWKISVAPPGRGLGRIVDLKREELLTVSRRRVAAGAAEPEVGWNTERRSRRHSAGSTRPNFSESRTANGTASAGDLGTRPCRTRARPDCGCPFPSSQRVTSPAWLLARLLKHFGRFSARAKYRTADVVRLQSSPVLACPGFLLAFAHSRIPSVNP